MTPAIRLSADYDAGSNRVDFMLHFAAPFSISSSTQAENHAPQCAPALLETGDGMRYQLIEYCSPTADTWRNIHSVSVGSHIYTQPGPYTAKLLWGEQVAETTVETNILEASAPALPEVQLFHPRPIKEPAMCIKLKLKVTDLRNDHRLRIHSGANQEEWLYGMAGPAQEYTWMFDYTKPGTYTVSVDLLDADGFWQGTLAESQVEIGPLEDEPIPATASAESNGLDVVLSPRARRDDTSDTGLEDVDLPTLPAHDVRPWILFYYVKPKFDWVTTYTTPGGSEIARSVSPGTYFAVRQAKQVGSQYWYETSEHGWVSADAVEVVRLSELRGVELGQAMPALNIESVIPEGKTPIKQGIITIERLNVRPRPGVFADNAPVDQVFENARVDIYAESFTDGATWYQIGIERWIYGEWVEIVGQPTTPTVQPPTQPPTTGTDGSTPPSSATRSGFITATVLNVRSQPGVSASNSPIDRLSQNSRVTLYEERTVSGDRWYRIGVGRWVHSGWVQLQTDSGTSPSTPTDSSGSAKYGTITANRLNVRPRPGISSENAPVGQLSNGTRVQIYESNTVAGAIWYRIGNERWVHSNWVALDRALAVAPNDTVHATTRDVGSAALPVGWVVSKTLSVRRQPGEGFHNPVVGRVHHNQALPILETRLVSGDNWYRIDTEAWVHGGQVGVAFPKPRPASIGPNERWVGINLSEQTAIAYEGDRPVYAMLVATGLPGTPTVQGVFRTWWRLRSRKMSGGQFGTPLYYNLEEVPWTCYFSGGYALHGAYWHDAFGRPRSHGCVNMSLYDSWWVFQWSAPDGDKAPAVYVYWK